MKLIHTEAEREATFIPIWILVPEVKGHIFQIPIWGRKEERKKVGLKLNIQKTKITAYGPITSWEIDGETVETVSDFIFGGSKIAAVVTAAMKLKDTYSLEGKLWPT